TRHRAARDPYFLYAASNLGSMAGLFGYVALIEPRFRLSEQTRLWAGGYSVLVVLFVGCAAIAWKAAVSRQGTTGEKEKSAVLSRDTAAIDWGRRARWIFLAFVPSSLMLGLTSYLT